jgi:predicted RNA binding protein YcfA (HicA-like mRNA interferase family)
MGLWHGWPTPVDFTNLQLTLVAEPRTPAHTPVSKKAKLLERAKAHPKDFTWDEACRLLKACGFEQRKGSGSARMFTHVTTRVRVRLHEPHPRSTLLPYMVDAILDALKEAGELEQ